LLPCPTANRVVHRRRLSVCATIASTRGPSNPQKARASCFADFPNPIHVSRNTPGFQCLAAPVTIPSPTVREVKCLYLIVIVKYTQKGAPSPATRKLPAGAPIVVLKSKGFADYSPHHGNAPLQQTQPQGRAQVPVRPATPSHQADGVVFQHPSGCARREPHPRAARYTPADLSL
jgi:hypothetical protein